MRIWECVWWTQNVCGGHKICVVDTKCVWWTQNVCGGHKMCVGDTKSVWETQNLCGRHKHTLHVTRYTCLRVCWILRTAQGFIFIDFWRMSVAKPRFSSQSCHVLSGFWRMSLTKWRFPAKKLTMPLTKRMFLNQNCFSRVRLWWCCGAVLSGARSKSRASRGKEHAAGDGPNRHKT